MDAFFEDVRPLCAKVRESVGAASDPIAEFRRSDYAERAAVERREGQGAAWI